jgi:predicted amidohydrolase
MAQLLDALAPGDICTHIFHTAGHNVLEDDFACLVKAKARGVILDDGMAGGYHSNFNMIRQALEKGITANTVSTDITPGTAFRWGGSYGLGMCMSILRSLGLTEETVLRMVTGDAARAIGKEKEIGFLQQGRSADICVLKYGALPFKTTSGGGAVIQSELGYVNLLTICQGVVMFRSLQNEI